MSAPLPQTEAQIQQAIRLALGREPDLVLWRANVGKGRILPDKTLHGIISMISRGQISQAIAAVRDILSRPPRHYGLPNGAADLCGILLPHGRWVCLEVKTPRGRQSEAQRLWGDLVRKMGGFYAVVRSVDDAIAAVGRAREGAKC